MNKISLGSRIFNLDDQKNFAECSGDKNPIHLDDDYARTTQPGQIIIHGINALLWALDNFSSEFGKIPELINARFLQPIYLNESVSCTYVEDKKLIEICSSEATLIRIKLSGKKYESKKNIKNTNLWKDSEVKIANNNFSDVELIDKVEYLNVVDSDEIFTLYPHLACFLNKKLLSEIVYLSTVVGMQVPGLHSIFVSASISLVNDNNENSIDIIKTDRRFGIVDLSVQSTFTIAKLRAIVRPAPQIPPDLEDIGKKITKRVAIGRRVLVIGGSRGLGSNVVRLLVLMGADVTFTYVKGFEEATALKNDLSKRGFNVNIKFFDILDPNYPDLFSNAPEFVLYFSTPKIFIKRSKIFEKELYKNFKRFYVDAYREILSHCLSKSVVRVFFPSTIAIDEKPSDLVEYVKAKSEGERLSEEYKNLHELDILVSRLPRTLTDQTASNLIIENKDPINVMLPIIEEFFDGY